ncbi:MAG TPA: DUF4129 domain-containing protein [Pirellulaceae bacterium]|nr:DUF4129 domain-containing protein [Pirellulaceae bacterium]
MNISARIFVLLFAALSLAAGRLACAQDQASSDAQSVQDAKEILSGSGRFPWYDRGKDDVRRLHAVPRDAADSRNRDSAWEKTPAAGGGGARPRFSLFGSALQWLGLTVLVVLLGVIAFLIAKTFLREEVSDQAVLRKVIESARDVDRVEALPFHVRKPSGDFLSEARRLYEAGEYSEAIIYLFSYQLVQLDRQHLIRLAKGKTNRQYLRELRQRPHLRAILDTTVVLFERAFFGRKTLTREQFEQAWRQLDDFHGELTITERAAA